MSNNQKNAARKVYISFLGTNNYALCNYYFNNDKSDLVKHVRFVQEAIARHECKGWTEKDKILVFLTSGAKKANWDDNTADGNDVDAEAAKLDNSQWGRIGDPKWGLGTQLKKLADEGLFPHSIITPIEGVDDSSSEEAIWNLFNLIYEKIEPNDEIYFDFTSGYRNLSMLGMVLLTYLKNTKQVSIGEIYYGAFDKLGILPIVKKMEVDKRNAPVLKLKDLNSIMDFSSAANVFEKYGNGMPLYDSMLAWAKNNRMIGREPEFTKQLQDLANALKKLTADLQTCRGAELCSHNDNSVFNNLSLWYKNLGSSNKNANEFKALGPILEIIENKYSAFVKDNSVANGFVAAKWCYDNCMYQQSVTFLQESIVSYYCEKVGLCSCAEAHRSIVEYKLKEGVDKGSKKKSFIKKLLMIFLKNLFEIKWIEQLRECATDGLLEEPFDVVRARVAEIPPSVGQFFQSLSQIRNDINHAGFLQYKKLNNGKVLQNDVAQKNSSILKRLDTIIGLLADFDNQNVDASLMSLVNTYISKEQSKHA